MIINLLVTVAFLAILWQLFTKAGKAGWTSMVPVYGSVVMANIAKKPAVLGWISGIASVVVFVYTTFHLGGDMISLASFVLWIVFGLIILNSFIKQYSAGIGRWIVFIFLPLIGVFLVKNVTYKGSLTTPTQGAPATAATPPAFVPGGAPIAPAATYAAPAPVAPVVNSYAAPAAIVNAPVQAPQDNTPQPPLQ